MTDVPSARDDRTVNNTDAVRHNYRVLNDAEKAQMVAIKDVGATFIARIDELRGKQRPQSYHIDDDYMLNIAQQRVEEAVMWAVKAITA